MPLSTSQHRIHGVPWRFLSPPTFADVRQPSTIYGCSSVAILLQCHELAYRDVHNFVRRFVQTDVQTGEMDITAGLQASTKRKAIGS